jgi:hypothetical protein
LTFSNVVAAMALLFAMGGGAYAATGGIGSRGVIHGCYAKSDGALRLVAAGAKCGRHQRAIAFHQTGPCGRVGPQGATGVQGPRGLQGATGTVDTSNFYTKQQSDGRYAQGAGTVTPIPFTKLANAATATLATIPSIGTLSVECALASVGADFVDTQA